MSVAFAYESDTIVIDPDEAPAATNEVDVRGIETPDGFDVLTWHRQMVFGKTACRLTINYRLVLEHRNRRYDGQMCPVCFTEAEIEHAELANLAEEESTK